MEINPVVLVVLDGFGVPPPAAMSSSPFMLARRPFIHDIEKFYPFTTLQASGIAVGLPVSESGNSEVGHLTIGSGRTLFQHLPRIISSIKDQSFFSNPAFLGAVHHVNTHKSALHIMGLFSTGSVHAYIDHYYALIDFAARQAVPTMLHIFSDGKDAPAREFLEDIKQLKKYLEKPGYQHVQIATIMGRGFSMDRDKRWERTQQAFDCLVGTSKQNCVYPVQYVARMYEQNTEDVDIVPAWVKGKDEKPVGAIHSNDAIITVNFREDSMRQLTHAFIDGNFEAFARSKKLENMFVATMTRYAADLQTFVAFPPLDVERPLAKVVSEVGKKQLHVAETEKYAHVTYFFNGGVEEPFPGEDRILIQSPRVPHFDESPRMSAEDVTMAVLENISKYDFTVVNFANADMVGHTGNFDATVTAVETVDEGVGRIMERVLALGGTMMITADHGNAEEKHYGLTGIKRTKHTINPVPFYLIGNEFKRSEPATYDEIQERYRGTKGVLADVAPTILALMGIPQPAEMTGISLIDKIA